MDPRSCSPASTRRRSSASIAQVHFATLHTGESRRQDPTVGHLAAGSPPTRRSWKRFAQAVELAARPPVVGSGTWSPISADNLAEELDRTEAADGRLGVRIW